MASRAWNFRTWKDGADLCAEGMATEFDDATTASGINAKWPGLVACSLPTGRCAATSGSPFPKVPFGTVVKVYNAATGRSIRCPVIDEGPAWIAEAGTGMKGSAMIDLTPAAVRELGMRDNAMVTVRIVEASKEHAESILHALRAMYLGEVS